MPAASLGASTSSSGIHIVDLIITEEVKTPWRYHWSSISEQTSSLCGIQTMPANLACENWGVEYTGVQVQWCDECNQMKQLILPDDEADTIPSPPRGGNTLPGD